MRKIGTYQLKTHLAEVLEEVENGQSVIVTRHGKPIARITPNKRADDQQTKRAVDALLNFPRTPLPRGLTIRRLIEEGRR